MKYNVVQKIYLVYLCLFSSLVHADIRYHWQDRFTPAQQGELRDWVDGYVQALTALVGPLPFKLHVYVYRAERGSEPVPWGQTRRGWRQGVELHVNTRVSPQALRDDWTLPHELSHLVLPYLGYENAWFAEGFASYMQYQVMMAAGVLSPAQARARYLSRFDRAQERYTLDDLPFSAAAQRLRLMGDYPTMYWGGALYFWQVEHALAREGTNLVTVLSEYIRCCRTNEDSIDNLVIELDRLAVKPVFSQTLEAFRQQEGFPAFVE